MKRMDGADGWRGRLNPDRSEGAQQLFAQPRQVIAGDLLLGSRSAFVYLDNGSDPLAPLRMSSQSRISLAAYSTLANRLRS